MKIVTVEQMRSIEAAAVQLGVSLDQLQRNAATAVAREVENMLDRLAGPALFIVGPGNNGRDALIAADLLRGDGLEVRVFLAPKVGSEDVLADLRGAAVPVHAYVDDSDLNLLRRWVADSGLVVDGLLGIGIHGPVREPIAAIISVAGEAASDGQVPVAAVDLPSGVNADTGQVAGVALRCNSTISLGCVKAGLLKFPAAEYVGRLIPVAIGLPEASYQSIGLELMTGNEVADGLPPRPLSAHKGSFGRVLVVAGSRQFVGAPFLVGAAAARSGCGLVTFAVPEWQRAVLAGMLPEATYLPLLDPDDSKSADANAEGIAETLPDCQALAIGPGLGQGPGQSRMVMRVLEAASAIPALRVVVDADGLNALSGHERWWERIGRDTVLTPHPGEMSRLTGLPVSRIEDDRWGVAAETAQRWGQVVVLKGAFSVVANPAGGVSVSPFAMAALATAGSGDVLTGLIAGFMAQGAGPAAAAVEGAFLHAKAALRVLETNGADRLVASDLIPAVPSTISDLRARRG